jgi:peptide deformylase
MIIRKSDLTLVPSTSPVLNNPPSPFDFTGDIDPIMLSNIMHDRMKELGGIGLAANQVGLNTTMFVLGSGDVKMSVFNPKILSQSTDEVSLDEGCLSFPGIYMKVIRPVTIDVEYQNEKGELTKKTLSGLTARIFLHEYDHMLGRTFKSRVSSMKWDLAVKKKKNKTSKIAKAKVQQLMGKIKEDLTESKNV